MRIIIFLLFIVGICAEAKGQQIFAAANLEQVTSPVFLSTTNYGSFDKVVLPPGYRMKKVGSTLTIAGAAMFVGGIIVISEADKTTYYNYNTGQYEYNDPKILLGSLMLVGGAGMMVPGIIFWAKGAKRYNRYLDNLQGSVGISGTGLAVRLKL